MRQSCSFNPFSLQSKQLQPDYASSYHEQYNLGVLCELSGDKTAFCFTP